MKKFILFILLFSFNSWALMNPNENYEGADVPAEVYNYEDNLDRYNKDRTEEYKEDYIEPEPYVEDYQDEYVEPVEPVEQYDADTGFDDAPSDFVEPYYEEDNYQDDYSDSY